MIRPDLGDHPDRPRTQLGRVPPRRTPYMTPTLPRFGVSGLAGAVQFRKEVRVLGALDVTGVARLVDADLDGSPAWLAVEYLDGSDLDAYVHSYGPIVGDAWSRLAANLLGALAEVHRVGVTHRDLKPANIVMSPDGPRIVDFGIALTQESTRLTQTGMMVGSLAWMSPEQGTGQQVGSVTDVFSLGLVLAFAALGRHPWARQTAQATLAAVLSQPPDLDGLEDSIRLPLSLMLTRDPQARPHSDWMHQAITGQAVDDASADASLRRWLLQRRAAAGDTDAMFSLGVLAEEEGDRGAARGWYLQGGRRR